MTANIVRRPSQETEGTVSPILFPDKSESGRVSVASEGCSLANLTQNVFKRASSDRGDGASSSLPLEAVASLEGKVEVVSSKNPIKLVEDYADSECFSDSEYSIEIIIQPKKVNDVNLEFSTPRKSDIVENVVKEIETPVKPLDQDLLQKVAVQKQLFLSPNIKDNQPSIQAALRKEEIEVWIKGSIEASNACTVEESNKEPEIKEEISIKPEKPHPIQLKRLDIDGQIDDFLENNPCTRFTNWMLSFIPKFIRAPKSSVEKAEEEKVREEQKNYEAFIARVKVSDKISKEKLEQVKSAKNKDKVFKQSFNTYQTLMTKSLRGYEGTAKDEKAFNRSMQIILNTRLK